MAMRSHPDPSLRSPSTEVLRAAGQEPSHHQGLPAMDWMLGLLATHTLWIVFANVLAEELGFPIPAYPTMMMAGAVVHQAGGSLLILLAVCVGAALLADLAWYQLGKRVGGPMIRTLCRISLEPDTCVAATRGSYQRWGPASLVFAKFITGFATLATAMAGEARTRLRTFLFFDLCGALLWSGIAIGLGVVFSDALNEALATLEALGAWSLVLLGAAGSAFVGYKLWQRKRFKRMIEIERIGIDELRVLLCESSPPMLIDVRSEADRRHRGMIPGAIAVALDGPLPEIVASEVVVYCACPDDASAALLARRLSQSVRVRVRPLRGGVDSWVAAGGHLLPPGGTTVER